MILLFTILNEDKNELFQKFFVERSYFSELQIKTIINSAPKLLNIVDLISKVDIREYSSKIFTITNLWIHIIKYKSFYYLFITPTMYSNNKKPISLEKEYFELIKQIEELITECTSNSPHFILSQNNYFQQNTMNLLQQFNKYLIKIYENIKKPTAPSKPEQIKNYYKNSKGKYLVVGSASAGKSSIIAQFFSNWDEKQINNIRPTINKEVNSFNDSLINHNFNLIDLGGQVQYVEMHLKDPNLFSDVHTLIYVIDVQDIKKIDFTKQYLLDIVSKMENQVEKPYISIFLHKFDPDVQSKVGENVQKWIEWIDNNLKDKNILYTYYLTSVKDNSARESFARTLLLTLPYWFLALTIKEDLIIRSLNSLAPILKEINEISNLQGDEILIKELYQQSVLFGFAATQLIIKKWINHLLKKSVDEDLSNKPGMQKDIKIDFTESDASISMQFKCPLLSNSQYDDYSQNSSVCEITYGVITGLSQFIGLVSVSVIQTQLRNKSDYCHFKISI